MSALKLVSRRLTPGSRAGATAHAKSSREDDDALIAEVLAGTENKASAFCQRVWRPVDRTVRRLLGQDDSEYEDLVQLAIMELIRSVASYRGEGSLDAWVSAVTAHVVYRHIRRRSVDRYVSLDALHDEDLHSPQPAGEEAIAERQSLDCIVRHLDTLGEKLAWSFIFHDVLGYGLRDVARIMGTTEGAAQSRLVRGRRRLHELMAADPALADLRESRGSGEAAASPPPGDPEI